MDVMLVGLDSVISLRIAHELAVAEVAEGNDGWRFSQVPRGVKFDGDAVDALICVLDPAAGFPSISSIAALEASLAGAEIPVGILYDEPDEFDSSKKRVVDAFAVALGSFSSVNEIGAIRNDGSAWLSRADIKAFAHEVRRRSRQGALAGATSGNGSSTFAEDEPQDVESTISPSPDRTNPQRTDEVVRSAALMMFGRMGFYELAATYESNHPEGGRADFAVAVASLETAVLSIWTPETSARWLASPNGRLGGAAPIEVLARQGPTKVLEALEASTWGVSS